MNELWGNWRIGGFLSFRELDQHSAAAYLSGVLIRALIFCLLAFNVSCISLYLWLLRDAVISSSDFAFLVFSCFCFVLFFLPYCMGTRAHFYHSFFFLHVLFSLGGLHFRSSSSLYPYCGQSCKCLHMHGAFFCPPFAFIITTSYPCVFLFALYYASSFFFFARAPRL